jgi:hypothetical protein
MKTFILLCAGSGLIGTIIAPTFEHAVETVYKGYRGKIPRSSLREFILTVDEAKEIQGWHNELTLATSDQPEFEF